MLLSTLTSDTNKLTDMLFELPELTNQETRIIQEIDKLRADLAYAAGPTKRWTGLLRRNAFARAVRGSNAIEGYYVTIDDAVAAVEGEEPIEPKQEAWLAVVGYRAAMTFVLQRAEDQHFSYSPEVLKSLHFMMLSYDLSKNPGLWRPGPIYVRDENTGEQVYEGPPAETVPALIDELVEQLNASRRETPCLLYAAMAHLNLVMIHPFSDGNGRMARSLQTLVLARSGIVAPLFSSIEEYLGANTRDYYDVLAPVGSGAWHPERDARPWIRYCLTAHFRQAKTLLRRTREIQKIWDELEIIIERRGLADRTIYALADATGGYKIRNPTYRRVAEVSTVVAGRDLRALVEAGLLEARGEKRGRYYVASPTLFEIRKRAAEPKQIADPFTEPQFGAEAPQRELILPRDRKGSA